jgi:hypothetical protein
VQKAKTHASPNTTKCPHSQKNDQDYGVVTTTTTTTMMMTMMTMMTMITMMTMMSTIITRTREACLGKPRHVFILFQKRQSIRAVRHAQAQILAAPVPVVGQGETKVGGSSVREAGGDIRVDLDR